MDTISFKDAVKDFFETVEELNDESLESQFNCYTQDTERTFCVTVTSTNGFTVEIWFNKEEICSAVFQGEDLRKLILSKFAVIVNEDNFKEKVIQYQQDLAQLRAEEDVDFFDRAILDLL